MLSLCKAFSFILHTKFPTAFHTIFELMLQGSQTVTATALLYWYQYLKPKCPLPPTQSTFPGLSQTVKKCMHVLSTWGAHTKPDSLMHRPDSWHPSWHLSLCMRRKDESLATIQLWSLPLVKLVNVINQLLCILKIQRQAEQRAREQEGQQQTPLN